MFGNFGGVGWGRVGKQWSSSRASNNGFIPGGCWCSFEWRDRVVSLTRRRSMNDTLNDAMNEAMNGTLNDTRLEMPTDLLNERMAALCASRLEINRS